MAKGFREVTILSGVSTLIRLIVMFFLNKITAVILGPSGFAVIGHVQNIFNISQALGGKSLQTGIVRYASQEDHTTIISDHFRAAVLISLVGAIATGIFIIATNALVPPQFLDSLIYSWAVPLIPFSIFALSLTTIFLARLQGTEQFRYWFIFSIVLLIIQVLFSLIALKTAGLIGLVSAMIAFPIVQLITIPLFAKGTLARFFTPIPPRGAFFAMNDYLLMGLVSIGLSPLVQVVIRSSLIVQGGIEEAGLWQGVLKLSELGILFVVSTLSTWYLPRLAKSSEDSETGKIMIVCGVTVFSVGLVGMIIGFLGGESILALVFSDTFRSASKYLNWQLALMIIQLLSWTFGSFFLIKGNVKEYICLEVTGQILSLILALILIPHFGVLGILYGFLIEGILYLTYLLLRLRRYFIAGIGLLRGEHR